MIATLTSVSRRPSRYGGEVYLLTFKGEDGKSYRSWVDPKNGNFQRWQSLIANEPKGVLLDWLVAHGSLIDADCYHVKVTPAPIETP